MRIGFFSDSYFPEIDGVTYTLKSWKDRLEARGHDVYIIYPDSDEYSPEENEIPYPSISNPFYDGYNIPGPTGTERIPELDIVHCHTPFTLGRLGLHYAKKNGLPTAYSHHTPIEEYFEQNTHSKKLAALLKKGYLPLENRFLRQFDVVTSNVGSINRSVTPTTLPVGLDMEYFQETESSFVDELDIGRPVLGYSGRLSMEKRVNEILELARRFDGSVIIVGEGPQREKLEGIAPANVVFMDFLEREKLPEFYSGIDLFVTSSDGDTLGLSTLEANACGTPVVAPDVFPFNNTISENQGGLYSIGDLEDFSSRVVEVLDNSYSTRKSVEPYALKTTINELEELYSGLSE